MVDVGQRVRERTSRLVTRAVLAVICVFAGFVLVRRIWPQHHIGLGILESNSGTIIFIVAAVVVGPVLIVLRDRVAAIRSTIRPVAATADTELLHDRLMAGIGMLANAASPAARLAGVRQIAAVADAWAANRQACIDTLSWYLRLPYDPETSASGEREVREAILRVFRRRLADDESLHSWRGLDLDFSGAYLVRDNLDGVCFSGGRISFDGAIFRDFSMCNVTVSGAEMSFAQTVYEGTGLSIANADLAAGVLDFSALRLLGSSRISFSDSRISGAKVQFPMARISGSVTFTRCTIMVPPDGGSGAPAGPSLNFQQATLHDGTVRFEDVEISAADDLRVADMLSMPRVNAQTVIDFSEARMSGGKLEFRRCDLLGGVIDFSGARITSGGVSVRKSWLQGSMFRFDLISMDGGDIDFTEVVHCDSGPAPEWGQTLLDLISCPVESRPEISLTDLGTPIGGIRFHDALLAGGEILFLGVEASASIVDFGSARFTGTQVQFEADRRHCSIINLEGAQLSRAKSINLMDSLTPVVVVGSTDPGLASDRVLLAPGTPILSVARSAC